VAIDAITIDPPMAPWPALLREQPRGEALGRSLSEWREVTRGELALAVDRPIIATGHQPTLWHPGILARYMAVSVCAERHGLAMANVVVDQDVADINGFDVPVRHPDGALASRRIELRRSAPPTPPDLPLGWQPAFDPLPLPEPLHAAIESAEAGARLVHQRLSAHAHAASAAEQVAAAFDDLMSPWTGARPMPRIMASSLMNTTLARAMLQAMVDDPRRCAEIYNRAAASVPGARLAPLLIRDDYVELPLWRLRDDGTAGRMRAYDNDVEAAVSTASQSSIVNRQSSISTLLPRALFMTVLIRMGACDLFIHGTGGALYDRAMERWIRDWLGVEVAPMAVASATLRLPLMSEEQLALTNPESLRRLQRAARDAWHDPDWLSDHRRPSAAKRALLARIEAAPRDSLERHAAFRDLHRHLAEERAKPALVELNARAEQAMRLAHDAAVARRRDWAFPLYPREMLDELKAVIAATTSGSHSPPPLAA